LLLSESVESVRTYVEHSGLHNTVPRRLSQHCSPMRVNRALEQCQSFPYLNQVIIVRSGRRIGLDA
jgi:hypothetical protein